MSVKLQKPLLDAGIVTRDPEAAHRFYGETLGLPLDGEVEIPGHGRVRRYRVGQSTLRIFTPLEGPALEGSRAGFASQTGIRYLCLYVHRLEEVVAGVTAAGFRLTTPVRELRPGVQVAQVEDADGNTVELIQES